MSVEVSSPMVENNLKDKKLRLYQSVCYPSKYMGFVNFSLEKENPKDFVFTIDLDEHPVTPLFYQRPTTEFERLTQNLHSDSSRSNEWVEILKCGTFTVHSVLKLLVEHINEIQTHDE